MIVWGWRGGAASAVREAFVSALRDRGFVEVTERDAPALVGRVGVDDAGAVVHSTGTGGLTIARSIARRVGHPGTFCELDLSAGKPRAQTMTIAASGEPSDARDRDAEASELVAALADDKPLALDATIPVLAALLGAATSPQEVARIALRRGRTSRTQALVEAVRAGASWERTELGGRVAIRVRGVDATRISFLEPEELADLERELSA